MASNVLTRSEFLAASATTVAAAAITPQAWSSPEAIPRPRALVLSGGVALGVYEAGVVKGLLERGFAFDIVCGSSIGAINGALIAQGDVALLEALWHSVARMEPPVIKLIPEAQAIAGRLPLVKEHSRGVLTRLFALMKVVRSGAHLAGGPLRAGGLIDPAGVRNVLRAVRLEKAAIPFLFAVSNVDRARAEAFYVRGTLPAPSPSIAGSAVPVYAFDRRSARDVAMYAEAVRASAAFPVAFAPVELPSVWGGRATERYLDGGVASNTPVRLARRAGARSAVCVLLQPDPPVPRPPNTLLDIGENLLTVNQQQLLSDEMLLAAQYQRLALYHIRPAQRLALDRAGEPFGFDDQHALDVDFQTGYEDGKRGPFPFDPTPPFATVR